MCIVDANAKQQNQEPATLPGIDDPSELRDGFDRELLDGSVDDLCEFFGLGVRVIAALHKLDITTGGDLAKLKPLKIHQAAGDVTGRRINLLREWARLRLAELGDTN